MRFAHLGVALLSSLPLLLIAGRSQAATVNISPGEDVQAAVNALNPGDELIVAGGMYTFGSKISFNVVGTQQMPIIIRAKDGEQPHFHRPNANQNIVDFTTAHYVEVRGIEFSGGSAGVRLGDVSHFTIEDCEIHSTNDVALRANDSGITYDSLRIIHNHIHDTDHTGEGMYLGCNNDGCRLANSLILRNYVHHTNQASITQGDGIELKEGSYGNTIADNVIHDTNYPCILTYSTVGNGAANIIERNAMWNCGDHAIQSAADTYIRNNIILSANVDGIRCQPHQSGAPSNIEIVHNTVVKATNNAVRCSGIDGAVLIANNALYAQNANAIRVDGDLTGVSVLGNAGIGSLQNVSGGFNDMGNLGSDFVAASFAGAPPNDVFPAVDSLLIGAGDAGEITPTDFNGTARNGAADVGAYSYDPAGNPGWVLQPDFKQIDGMGGEGGGGTGGGMTGSGGSGGSAQQGAGGGAQTGSGVGGTGGGTTNNGVGGGTSDDGDCSCSSVRSSSSGGFGWLAAAAIGLALSRRRRSA